MVKKVTKTSKNVINFWAKLPKPIFVLAPMANVTDSVFRKVIAKYGKPDVTWTEFVSCDGLISSGRENLLHDLVYSEKERPIVAQLFTGNPDSMKKAAQLVAELDFDGLDINMGCPDRAVEKQGGGAASIKNPKNALAVLQAAREGFSGSTNFLEVIPVSIKTRIGYNTVDFDWLKILLQQKLPVLTVHLRTRKEMSDVPAHWELMPEIVKLRNEISPETLIIGNGDVYSTADAAEKVRSSGCDGVMIGRGIFGKPWLFNVEHYEAEKAKTPEERLTVMVEHAKLFEKTFQPSLKLGLAKKDIKNFAVMKKHFKAYVSGWDGAKELRVKLMETNNAKEVKKIVEEYLGK
ncbi:MAG: tRNA-dihydrouridine synthase [bacterium]|nr:tRNA-dihydrouridine synthase [bacterium]